MLKKEDNDMTDREFCYWLQGFFEIENPQTLSPTQVKIIKDHLALVFHKVTPNRANGGFIGQDNIKIPIMTDITWNPEMMYFPMGPGSC